jgi:adenosine deaminase
LEGAIGPSEFRALSARHGTPAGLPDQTGLFHHASFDEFLQHFGAITHLLREPEDLAWLLHRHLGKLRRQGVLYAEVRISPAVWERRGLDPLGTLSLLCGQAGRTPIPFRFVIDAVRHWDGDTLARDLDLCLRFRKRGVVALGLGGDEAAAPARSFIDLAAECRSLRLPVIPHAGEALGPGEVLDALEVFRPLRVGHGIRAADDPKAIAACHEAGVHLEICPTSNRKTGAYARGLGRAFARLWEGRVDLSVSTDDPGLFGTTLGREIRWASRALGLDPASILRMQASAARASLLPEGEKKGLLAAFGTV